MNKTDRVTISDQKFEILRLRTKGFPTKLIAARLQITDGTVKGYLSDAIKRINYARQNEHRLCRYYHGQGQ